MPEMRFTVVWPDGVREICYSPSLVIKDFFTPNESYPLPDFRERSRSALMIASDRVREKFGFACSRAAAQLVRIEERCDEFAALPEARVFIESFIE